MDILKFIVGMYKIAPYNVDIKAFIHSLVFRP